MLGQTTTHKQETWNNSSDSAYEYNRTDHSDWDYSYTDDYGVQYKYDGFTHHQQSSHSDSNRLDIGNRMTTTGSTGTIVSGSRTLDNSANGGWDSTQNGRSFDKTTRPADPYGGASWNLTESTSHSTGNVSWSFAENYQTDYATGITTGTTTNDPYGGNPASGGGHYLGKYRVAHNNGHGNSSDSGLQTMYEYWWSADESNYGQAPGKRAGLQTMPARTTGGGPEGTGKGNDLLAQAGSALGNMMGNRRLERMNAFAR